MAVLLVERDGGAGGRVQAGVVRADAALKGKIKAEKLFFLWKKGKKINFFVAKRVKSISLKKGPFNVFLIVYRLLC